MKTQHLFFSPKPLINDYLPVTIKFLQDLRVKYCVAILEKNKWALTCYPDDKMGHFVIIEDIPEEYSIVLSIKGKLIKLNNKQPLKKGRRYIFDNIEQYDLIEMTGEIDFHASIRF